MKIVARSFCVVALIAAAGFIPCALYAGDGFTPTDLPNTPMGTARGAMPGRVAWAFDARAATWDGTTNSPSWWADANTHPAVVKQMVAAVIRSAGGADDNRAAWDRLFRYTNGRRGRGALGYQGGEKIAIKLNLNQSRSHGDNGNASYIAPQLVCALVGELVRNAGVAAP